MNDCGIFPELCAGWGEGSVRAVDASVGLTGERPSEPFPDLADWPLGADCDLDGILGWGIWCSLRTDVLIDVATNSVLQLLATLGIPDTSLLFADIKSALRTAAAEAAGIDVPSPLLNLSAL